MIAEVKELLGKHDFSKVAIIDDAYDESPSPEDLAEPEWSRFFDDIDDTQEERLRTEFGLEDYDKQGPDSLRRDMRFVSVAWSIRADLGAPGTELFREFESQRASKRSVLEQLERLVGTDLQLPFSKIGRREDPAIHDAQIIFLDLFLGSKDDQNAVDNSIRKIKQVVEQRRGKPPVVVLMSASPTLDEFASIVRDKAELLGCQFRTIRKSQLSEAAVTLQKLYDLVVCYPDSQRLSTFVNAWDQALAASRIEFLKTIRNLDLADYANMQALVLEAEDLPVGDYVVDLYDLYLHNVIEGNSELIRAAKALNDIKWDDYPPAQFMPSSEAAAITEGALFHHQKRTMLETELGGGGGRMRFGDVLLSAKPAPPPAPAVPAAAQAPGDLAVAPAQDAKPVPRWAYMVMSQACDLLRGETDRVLLLRAATRPHDWHQHDNRRSNPKTPVMSVDGEKLALEWDLLAPETWMLGEIPARMADGKVRLARRFRTPFALQLQQLFLQTTGRVGTLAGLPPRYAADVSVFLRTSQGKAKLVARSSADREDAVCLVGRTKKNELKEWLLLSESFSRTLVEAFNHAKTSDPPKHAKPFTDAVDSPAFVRALKAGLVILRDGSSRPFKQQEYDVVEVSTKPKWTDGQDIGTGGIPILIEVTLR